MSHLAGAFGIFLDVLGPGPKPDPIARAGAVGRCCGIAVLLLRSSHPLIPLLRRAERDDEALARALAMINALPTTVRRRLIATYGAIAWARPQPGRSRTYRVRRRSAEPSEPVAKFSDLPRRGAAS